MLRSLKCLLLDLLQQRFASIHDVGRGALYSPDQFGYDSGTLFGIGNRRQNQKSLLVGTYNKEEENKCMKQCIKVIQGGKKEV